MAKDIQQQEAALRQRTNDTSLDVELPGLEADRLVQGSDEDIEALADLPDDEGNIDLSAESDLPSELREEDIGLAHVAGVNDAEIGRELNLNGDQDNDEDDRGNPTGATQFGNP